MLPYELILFLFVVHADITSSADLNCDFSSSCRWRNASVEDNEGFFAYTNGFMGRSIALLVSDVANCQLGGGSITYWYFKTGDESKLEVCTRQPPGSKDLISLKCYDGLTPSPVKQWIFRVLELPPLSQPFELVFRGIFYPPIDVIAVTDISYSSTLCDVEFAIAVQEPKIPFQIEHQQASNFASPTAFRQSFSEQSSPRVGVSFAPPCPVIDCTFDESTMCNYVTSVTDPRINGTLKDWEISSKAVLNSLTGIPQDFSKSGSFIYAGGKNVSPHDIYILSSKLPVELKEQARLDFFVYQAGRLQVCINTINNCALNIKGSTIDIKARRWKNYHVPLASDTHAIHFVVDGLHDNYAIGLDHIQLIRTARPQSNVDEIC
uniref:MAM domain-containing protein n=1 Tax=Angiostrongylus cantonensis TaxID=6313 RepID=A0A0K0CVP5_ANGCA